MSKQPARTYMAYMLDPNFEVFKNKGGRTRFIDKTTRRVGPWVNNPHIKITQTFETVAKKVNENAAVLADKFREFGNGVSEAAKNEAIQGERHGVFGSNVLTKHITKVTKDELFAALDHHGVEYNPKSTKADLRALLQDTLR